VLGVFEVDVVTEAVSEADVEADAVVEADDVVD
jgi:hypothetical protein